ncbi:MAG: ABC transporter permease [Atopobiaceae bacterium]
MRDISLSMAAKCAYVLVCVLLAVFVAYPLGLMVATSFTGEAPLANFAAIVASNAQLVANSVGSAVLASLMSTALAFFVALVIVFGPRRLSRPLMGVSLLGIISPPFVASLAYVELFGRRGLISHYVLGLSISPYGWHGVVVMQAVFFASINVLLLVSVLERIDTSILEAAQDLGAKPGEVLSQMVVPLAAPTLGCCLLLTIVRCLSDYGTPVVIGGGFETIATSIYMQVVGYSDLRASAVLNMILLIMCVAVFFVYNKLMLRADKLVQGSMGSSRMVREERLGGILGVIALVVGIGYLAFMVLEYTTIFMSAFLKGITPASGFTLKNFNHLFTYDLMPLMRSIVYAALAALVATLVGSLVAYFSKRRRVRGRSVLEFVVTMPYMLPGTCIGLGYILAFNSVPLKLTGTAFILVAVLVAKHLTVSSNALSQSMLQIPEELDLAARDLGASEMRAFSDVIVPNLKEATTLSMVNMFSGSMVAYGAVLFLVTPAHKTAVFVLFDSLSGGKYGQAAMLSVAIIVISVLVNVLIKGLVMGRVSSDVSQAR